MNLIPQVLDRLVDAFTAEPLLQLAVALSCSAIVVVGSILFVAKRLRPHRRQQREFVGRPVLVRWVERAGPRQSDDGFCEDLSTEGIGMDLPFRLRVGSRVDVRMSEANLSRSGIVRRCTRHGERYAVGVAFDRRADPAVAGD